MRKTALVLALVIGLTLYAAEGRAQMGPGMMGPGYGYGMGPGMMGGGGYSGSYCPYCGQYTGPGGGYGMGYGMEPGYGYGMGPGMMGRGYGGYGMGPGMMGPGYGYGMGPGMMGRGYGGYGMGPGMMGPGYGYGYGPQPQYEQPQNPLEEKDAKAKLENYLASTRNPNLKLGKIEDKGNAFEADIVTKDGSIVDKILVDKNTGWMRSAY